MPGAVLSASLIFPLFNPYNHLMRWKLLWLPFFKWENQGTRGGKVLLSQGSEPGHDVRAPVRVSSPLPSWVGWWHTVPAISVSVRGQLPGTLCLCNEILRGALWDGFCRDAIAKVRFHRQGTITQLKEPMEKKGPSWAECTRRSGDKRQCDIFLQKVQGDHRGHFRRGNGEMSPPLGTCLWQVSGSKQQGWGWLPPSLQNTCFLSILCPPHIFLMLNLAVDLHSPSPCKQREVCTKRPGASLVGAVDAHSFSAFSAYFFQKVGMRALLTLQNSLIANPEDTVVRHISSSFCEA